MSGFPAIRPGLKLKPVGKQGLMTRNQANTVLAVCNGVLNSKLIDTDSDEFHITPNNAVYGIGRGTKAAGVSSGMYPFKLYPTGTIDGSGHIGYNVRNGVIEVRPLYHLAISLWYPNQVNEGFYGTYAVPSFVDSTSVAFDSNEIITPAQFYLDPTPEISGGLNYGALYAFFIRITPDTDNGGAYNGAVEIVCERRSAGSGLTYPYVWFPGSPDGSGRENIPLAFLQLTAPTASGPILTSAAGNNGAIFQIHHDNVVGRFPAGQNGMAGFNYQGDWIISGATYVGTPGLNSGHRVWYPGDLVRFENLDSPSVDDGTYLAVDVPSQLGGTPTSPAGAHIIQIASNRSF